MAESSQEPSENEAEQRFEIVVQLSNRKMVTLNVSAEDKVRVLYKKVGTLLNQNSDSFVLATATNQLKDRKVCVGSVLSNGSVIRVIDR
jgi:chaperonin cofactor prefoldin